jgi:hypothetical protein
LLIPIQDFLSLYYLLIFLADWFGVLAVDIADGSGGPVMATGRGFCAGWWKVLAGLEGSAVMCVS